MLLPEPGQADSGYIVSIPIPMRKREGILLMSSHLVLATGRYNFGGDPVRFGAMSARQYKNYPTSIPRPEKTRYL